MTMNEKQVADVKMLAAVLADSTSSAALKEFAEAVLVDIAEERS